VARWNRSTVSLDPVNLPGRPELLTAGMVPKAVRK
jgi:hypothetical protein